MKLTGHADTDLATIETWLGTTDPTPVIIETSGSTGNPKRVSLTRAAVLANATASLARLDVACPWELTLPSSYVAGLQVIVRALLAGQPVTNEPTKGAAVSLVPTQLHRMLEDEPQRVADYALILLGGGPIDPALRARAEQLTRVVATYGSSETAGGCVYDGRPLDGVRVRIGESGRVELAGPMLFTEYVADPVLTAQTLVEGWLRTSDAGTFEDGRLRISGRLDDVVISGGVNVPTPAVAARLRAHPAVEAVEVLGVPDPEWGHRVVAFVVGTLTPAQARDWVAAQHPRTWAPRQLIVLDSLPLLGNGKVDRTSLRELA